MKRKRIESIIEKARKIGICPFMYRWTVCFVDTKADEMVLGIRMNESMRIRVQSSVKKSGIKKSNVTIESDYCLQVHFESKTSNDTKKIAKKAKKLLKELHRTE